ncbi:MAG: VPLPA-CTERM sorting domain-containing protein [Methylococcaceae bacterium]
MKKKQFWAIMLLAQASLASAATTVFTDEATFLAQIKPGYYLEEFSNYTYNENGSFPLDGTQMTQSYEPINGYSWTAATIPDGTAQGLNGLFSIPNALSTWAAEDLLTITFTGSPVTALGGIFASTDSNGDVTQQEVVITLSDNDNTSVRFFGSDFRGFTSDIAIASLTIDAVDVGPNNVFWPKLDRFYIGSVLPDPVPVSQIPAVVPVPAAIWLFGSGLLGLFSLTRRSKFD